jgi:Na+-translocating ferredoxin:NAD+ oxidoreductase RnfD subunit
LLVGHLTYGIIEIHYSPILAKLTFGLVNSYSPTFVAILVAIGMEILLGRLIAGRWPHLASSYISGISVGILIRSPELWPYVLCSAISIASKYAIRFRGRHLWNPSNLGVSAMLFLAPASVASLSVQWGNEIWPIVVIWCLGTLTLYRVGRLHISVTYVIAFLLLGFVRSAVTGDSWLTEVAPITGPMYQLFTFFMITDPKTTTKTKWSQCLVAALVAVAEVIFRLNQVIYAPFYALFVVGPIANFIEILIDGRRAPAPG